ncbi:HDOD domain-containing protein, partial [bacterium]|nr:HDOD domain-containing protein [bacterium]
MSAKDQGNKSEGDETTSSSEILLPPERALINEARRLLSDDSRTDSLATICLQDPVILIELLKKANALFFAGGRAAITSAKTALVRLGSDVVQELFDEIASRPDPENQEVAKWIQKYRSRSRRIGIISRLFSETLAKNLNEDCQAIGSLFSIGDMLAVHELQETYVELAEDQARTSVNYKLSTAHRFDVEEEGIDYLRRNGIPETLVFAMERDSRPGPRYKDRAIMKPLCLAAMELVDAFDQNKWERLAPGKKLAPKSAVRLLNMSDAQYLKVYERASEYLFSARMLEEKKRLDAEKAEHESEETAQIQPVDNDLQSEIDSLLGLGGEEET